MAAPTATRRNKPSGNKHQTTQPVGRLVALLGASAVTLTGVIRGLDPDMILMRASVAAVVLGLSATSLYRLVFTVTR